MNRRILARQSMTFCYGIFLVTSLLVTTQSANAADALIAEGATVQKLSGGFAFTEGPAADKEGNVYFSDIPNNRIHIWSTDGKLSTFRENSGGANGLFFDREGNLIACEGSNRQVTSIAPGGEVTVLADSFDGKKLNSPNDLWIDPEGGVYFTDPRYGPEDNLEQSGFHVFYISADRSTVARVIDDLVKPNGIIGTPDGKTLYVADLGDGKTYAYAIDAPGQLGERKLFAAEGSDGVALDEKGNLYLTTGRGVPVYSPSGEKLMTISVPEGPANVCFGGADGKTLFITARTGLYSLRMNVTGQ
jgi:gluconolactonase